MITSEQLIVVLSNARSQIKALGSDTDEVQQAVLAEIDGALAELRPREGMAQIALELTKEELMVLGYALPYDSDGDPLKDIYEFEHDCKHEIDDAYKALKSLNAKVWSVLSPAIASLPSNGRG